MTKDHTLHAWHNAAWELLVAGVAERDHACRTGVLATCGQDGAPEARWVVLRRADRIPGEVEVHTDSQSTKIRELKADPRAALSFWDPVTQVQLRLRLEMTMLTGDSVQDRWDRIPESGRLAYGGEPAPGTPLARPEDHDAGVQRARFCALVGRVYGFDMVHLGEDRHRRAVFARADSFAGQWLAP